MKEWKENIIIMKNYILKADENLQEKHLGKHQVQSDRYGENITKSNLSLKVIYSMNPPSILSLKKRFTRNQQTQ